MILAYAVLLVLLSFQILSPRPAFAIGESSPIHFSGDHQYWDRKNNHVELFGHATVNQPGETLTADYISLDLKSRILDAKGNCVYVASDSVMNGEEMHFNLDTRTGSIVQGRVSNDRFTLIGERINKLGEGRFQTHQGEYTTCRDCPRSWSLLGQDVDMQMEGYAYMSDVVAKIKDAPAFWFPYLIVPLKTRRQSGFLFPELGFGTGNGFSFVQPYFWAINDSSDMTIGFGDYTSRGRRIEWEGRYALSQRSRGRVDYYNLHDKTYKDTQNRWAVDAAQIQELPWGFEEKFRYTDVSDSQYPIFFTKDVPGQQEPVLSSNAILSYSSSQFSAYVALERFRNLISLNPDTTQFDPYTVQAYPNAVATTNDQFLFGTPIASGLTLGVNNFTRTAPAFDYAYVTPPPGALYTPPSAGTPFTPGVDPVRKATRVSVTPALYTTLRPLDMLSLVPSAQYRSYFYSFHGAFPQSGDNALERSYLLTQLDLSTQLEKVYETNDPLAPRIKHLIRPTLTYSNIPYVRQDRNHPFIQQTQVDPGYKFDDNDIVPIDNQPIVVNGGSANANTFNYFYPLGNSLAYGISTQLIRRKGKIDQDLATYQNFVEFNAGQSVNFREFEHGDPQPLSRFYANLETRSDHFQTSTTYYYYPYIPGIRHQLSTGETYIFERAMHQRILTYDRSVVLGYSWNQVGCPGGACGSESFNTQANYSVNDYILPSLVLNYDLIQHQFFEAGINIQFQSPSQCWKFTIGTDYNRGVGYAQHTIDLALNITGSGYGGVSDFSKQATGQAAAPPPVVSVPPPSAGPPSVNSADPSSNSSGSTTTGP